MSSLPANTSASAYNIWLLKILQPFLIRRAKLVGGIKTCFFDRRRTQRVYACIMRAHACAHEAKRTRVRTGCSTAKRRKRDLYQYTYFGVVFMGWTVFGYGGPNTHQKYAKPLHHFNAIPTNVEKVPLSKYKIHVVLSETLIAKYGGLIRPISNGVLLFLYTPGICFIPVHLCG